MTQPRFDMAITGMFDSGLPNAWIAMLDPQSGKKVGEVYVRRDSRRIFYTEPDKRYNCFDISNIQVDPELVGRGIFTRWLENIVFTARHVPEIEAVYIENVMDERFQQFIFNRLDGEWGLEKHPDYYEQYGGFPSFWHETSGFPDTWYAKKVCAIGQVAATCAYLGMGANGWACMKGTSLKSEIDRRVAAGEMHARSDNCDGLSDR